LAIQAASAALDMPRGTCVAACEGIRVVQESCFSDCGLMPELLVASDADLF